MKALKKQAEDIELMTARMDEQIASLTKAYKEELREIEVNLLSYLPLEKIEAK